MNGDRSENLFQLAGKVAVVTGGAGILGRHFCKALASSGATVVVVDSNKAAGDALLEELNGKSPVKHMSLQTDISDSGDVRELTDRIQKQFGRVDILLNNAATKTQEVKEFFKDPFSFSMETWNEVMSVNITGMFLVARSIGELMVNSKRGGSIIQTGSIYGLLAPDVRIYEGSEYLGNQISTPAVYTTSKAAVIGLTKHLAAIWGPAGVRVNVLIPGGVESGQNETFKKRYADRVPLGRMAQVEDLIGPMLFLASDASRYVTGHSLVVDGGLSVW